MPRRRLCLSLSLFARLLVLGPCGHALAQQPAETPTAPTVLSQPAAPISDATDLSVRYDASVRDAIAAQALGDFEGAHQRFEQAHTLRPNARTLRGMGVASFQARHFARSIRELDAALVHPEKPLDAELRRAVEELRQRASAEVGVWILRVEPPEALVSIDGGEASPSSQPLVLDPGLHQLRLTADGFVEQVMEISVMPGTRGPMAVRLAKISDVLDDNENAQVVVPLPTAPATREPPPDRRPHQRRMIAAYALLGLSGAAGIAASGLYAGSTRRIRLIAKECRNESPEGCSPQQYSDEVSKAKLKLLERSINASLGMAGVALASAAGFLAWDYLANGRRLELRVASDSVQLHGSF